MMAGNILVEVSGPALKVLTTDAAVIQPIIDRLRRRGGDPAGAAGAAVAGGTVHRDGGGRTAVAAAGRGGDSPWEVADEHAEPGDDADGGDPGGCVSGSQLAEDVLDRDDPVVSGGGRVCAVWHQRQVAGISVVQDAAAGQCGAAQLLYKYGFSFLLIGVYLTWIAAVLALISTASIFPDLMTGGSIDLYLSKPIGRVRLFFTKYVSGLLFVTLQVSVFAVGSFLVLGWRGHSWEPSLFLAIPIVVVFFSYLYGICALLGVMMRSTIAALLLTLLAWFFIFAVDYVDKKVSEYAVMIPQMRQQAARQVQRLDVQIAAKEREAAAATQTASTGAATAEAAPGRAGRRLIARSDLAALRSERDSYARETEGPAIPPALKNFQTVLLVIKTFVPKTRETTNLLDRYLLPDWELEKAGSLDTQNSEGPGDARMMAEMVDPTRGQSAWWVVGSSLGFEAVCVGLAAWIFKRRDY